MGPHFRIAPAPLLNVSRDGVPLKPYRTMPDKHKVYRVYPHKPSYVPDLDTSLEDMCDGTNFEPPAQASAASSIGGGISDSWMKLLNWWYSAAKKSQRALQGLVDLLGDRDFHVEDVVGGKVTEAMKKLDSSEELRKESGWMEGTVRIPLPCPRVKCAEGEAPTLDIPGVLHRKWRDIITETFSGSDFKHAHLTPFTMHQSRPGMPDTRVISEVYNSDAMLEEHIKLQARQNAKDDKMEVVVAAIMNWSDSTHLAQFGNASLWPLYTAFGNVSQYIRSKPKEFCLQHVAYIPSVIR
jgi:hypothetical protein